MKIALIYFGRKGGGPVYSLEIAKELAKKTDLLAFISRQTENLKFWQKSGVHLYQVSTYTNFLGFLLSLFNFKKFFLIFKKIKSFSPDIIYYPFFHPWFPIINLLFPRVPKVFTVHDPILHKGERNFFLIFLQNITIKKCQRIIILSNIFRKTLVAKNVPEENIDVIPHGIFDYYKKFREGEILKEEELHPPTILFFGRIIEYKGLNLLLKAFSLIKKEIKEAKLLIVGEGDLNRYKTPLKELKDIKVENRWIKDEEIGGYFSGIDLLVCPYIEASQSGVIPIAYMFKIPVVATEVGGLEEQVNHGITGFLVSPNNPEELAKACINLLKDREKAKQMGENGFKKAFQEWNWETISEKVFQALKKTTNY